MSEETKVGDELSDGLDRPQDLYYLQDRRQYVGNSMLWWRKNGKGYTCEITEAHVFTREEAYSHHESRDTDVPWRKDYIDARISSHIDAQKCDREHPDAA